MKRSIFRLSLIVFAGTLFGKPSPDLPAFHPFKSEKAKKEFLDLYEKREKDWPVPFEGRMVETSFGKTFVRISGPVDGMSLVLLPGASVSSLMWKPNIEKLSESYKTYAVDNISDFGRSIYIKPPKKPEDLTLWLDELFTGLALGDNINLVGMSYGGWQTALYALHHPKRLSKIVLIAPGATILPLSGGLFFRTFLAVVHPHFHKKLIYWIFKDAMNGSDESRQFVDDFIEETFTGKRCFKAKGLIPQKFTDEELKKIKAPALFLVGENEKLYSAQKAVQRFEKITPDIKTAVISGAGHDLTIVQADLVSQKILEFLRQSE